MNVAIEAAYVPPPLVASAILGWNSIHERTICLRPNDLQLTNCVFQNY